MIDLTPYTDSNGDIDLKKELIQNIAGIVESGSHTSRGDWIKFEDGTMICTHTMDLNFVVNSYVQATWIFPQPFITPPAFQGSILFSQSDITPTSKMVYVGSVGTWGVQAHQVDGVRVYNPWFQTSPFVSGDKVRVNMQVIGRWK